MNDVRSRPFFLSREGMYVAQRGRRIMDPMTDSRQRVQAALNMALGQYIDQEPEKGHVWRSRSISEIVEHIEREVAEIRRRTDSERLLHDALDLTCLGAILAARILLEEGTQQIGDYGLADHGLGERTRGEV